MWQGISISFNPIGPWPLLVGASAVVLFLTIWAYSRKLKGSDGSWRYVAITLRLLALLLCLLAALRPSVVLPEKKKQEASLVFLIDTSSSMSLSDEVRGQSRWAVARETLGQALESARSFGPDLQVKVYEFARNLREIDTDEGKEAPESNDHPDDEVETKKAPVPAVNEEGGKDEPAKTEEKPAVPSGKPSTEPSGRETQLGTAMLEAEKREEQNSKRIARMVILSDFASNNGTNPLIAARRLRDQQVPVLTIGLGTQNAAKGSMDIAIRDIATPPTVFVKNQLEVRGSLQAPGFAGQEIEVELHVEGEPGAVAKTHVKAPDGAASVPITGLKYTPKTNGDKMVTLKVKPREGEFVLSNNEISTIVNVLSGGLNVMFLQGPNFTWDYRYLMRSIGTSPDIQVEGFVLRRPARGEASEVEDAEFAPGRYNIYVLSDLPADYLAPHQHKLLADAVRKGAGLIMLGGRTSFGPGGWAGTDLADILPAEIHAGDGQLEPEGGIKFVPSSTGLTSYILQVGGSKAETAKLWEMMPPILGTSRFGEPKRGAEILAQTPGPNPEPLMLAMDGPGAGRVIAYGGDTWVWARASEEGRLAHRKFWRQTIFWLSHKENQGDNQVQLSLDRRRMSVGQQVGLTVTARDAKGAPIPGVIFETVVEREGLNPIPEPVETYTPGDEARGTYTALGEPGVYRAKVVARKDGKELGSATSRFLVYQDDRELENPSADLALARQIAEITGGEAVPHEGLDKLLKGIDQSNITEYVSETEHRIWDNWPFLLIFTALLTIEWWLRKRHGWV
jgi:hypothetical protein